MCSLKGSNVVNLFVSDKYSVESVCLAFEYLNEHSFLSCSCYKIENNLNIYVFLLSN